MTLRPGLKKKNPRRGFGKEEERLGRGHVGA